jgi:hypothetical protein
MSASAFTVDVVDSPSLFPEAVSPLREFDVTLTVPRGDRGPLVPDGFPSGVLAAFAAEFAVFSLRVQARDDVAALVIARDLVAAAAGWVVPLGQVACEVRPAGVSVG